jgi:hypothetical protein
LLLDDLSKIKFFTYFAFSVDHFSQTDKRYFSHYQAFECVG